MRTFLILQFLIHSVQLLSIESDSEESRFTKYQLNDNINVTGYAVLGQIPYFAVLAKDFMLHCGSSIISRNYVITAAHCIHRESIYSIDVIIATVKISPEEGIVHKPAEYLPHPQYNSLTTECDIGLIRVRIPFDLSTAYAKAIPLTYMEDIYPSNTTAFIGGCALNISPYYETTFLKFGHMSMHTLDECNNVFTPPLEIYSICASNYFAVVFPRPGDSGDPLVLDNLLYAVLSQIVIFKRDGYGPSLFMRISCFREWILRNSDVPKDNPGYYV